LPTWLCQRYPRRTVTRVSQLYAPGLMFARFTRASVGAPAPCFHDFLPASTNPRSPQDARGSATLLTLALSVASLLDVPLRHVKVQLPKVELLTCRATALGHPERQFGQGLPLIGLPSEKLHLFWRRFRVAIDNNPSWNAPCDRLGNRKFRHWCCRATRCFLARAMTIIGPQLTPSTQPIAAGHLDRIHDPRSTA